MVLILHERKAQEYRGHEAGDRKLIQSSIQCYWEVNLAFFSSTGSHIFLVIRRALDNSKRLLSFPWPAPQAFEREKNGI